MESQHPGKTPEGLDLSPDGRELWTVTRGDGGVSIIDTVSRKVIQSFSLKLTDANRVKFRSRLHQLGGTEISRRSRR